VAKSATAAQKAVDRMKQNIRKANIVRPLPTQGLLDLNQKSFLQDLSFFGDNCT